MADTLGSDDATNPARRALRPPRWVLIAAAVAGVAFWTTMIVAFPEKATFEAKGSWSSPTQIAWNLAASAFAAGVMISLVLPRSLRQRNPTVPEVLLLWLTVTYVGYFLPIGSVLTFWLRWCRPEEHQPSTTGHSS